MKTGINLETGRYWDLPWSLVSGCTRCSPGCDNCWALAMERRFRKPVEMDYSYLVADTPIQLHPERLSAPLKRKKPTVYAIWNDLHHKDVRESFQEQVYNVIESCNQHTFLILTKRPYGMFKFIEWYTENGKKIPDNIWHGLTVVNQQEADEKIPIFLQVPGKKFLSIEPCLEEINVQWTRDIEDYSGGVWQIKRIPIGIDAVILGGETGPGARPMHPDWARSVRNQCEQAGVPFFLKHVSKEAGRILDGRTHNNLPWVKS
jgi:protein gp37